MERKEIAGDEKSQEVIYRKESVIGDKIKNVACHALKNGGGLSTLRRVPIAEAEVFLEKYFVDIRSVEEWSEKMGYGSRQSFWRKFDAHFHKSPRDAYIKMKKIKLIKLVRSNNDYNNRELAQALHYSNGNDLYRFVKRHFGCTPTQLKLKILSKNRETEG